MSNALKTFIIREELRTSHAARFLTYVDQYHAEVILDLKKNLERAWQKLVGELVERVPVNQKAAEERLLNNPKATLKLELVTTPENITSTRSREASEVSPSVKVPIVYSREERDLIEKNLLQAADEAMQQTTSDWSEIFKYEQRGRAMPVFKILSDHDGVRLQLTVRSGDAEEYKTLYAIHTEYAKPGSKLRDFDRVYLTSLIKT